MSCASPSFCVAVGDSGTGIRPAPSNLAEVVSSTAPLAGIWRQAELGGAHGGLFGVACPASALCVAGDMFGNVVGSASPAGPASAWTSFNAGPSVQVTGASCGSPTQCLLTDDNGDALTSSEPLAGGRAWTTQNLIPYVEPLIHNALFSASCPTPSFCAIGATGEVLTSTDPGAPPPSLTPPKSGGKSTGKGKGKKKHKARPKRPRVVLASAPPPEIFRPHGKAFLQFRFHVKREIQVRGYVCSFDGGKMGRCRSPQRFRVGAGHHVFAVRAVGWTGLWGRPARAPVQVCRHSVIPSECLERLPPPAGPRRASR